MPGPQSDFNGLSRDKHGVMGALNEDINRQRAAHMDQALNGKPALTEQVTTTPLEASAQRMNEPAANQDQFFTGPDKAREAKRRAGPPADMLRKHSQ